MKRTPNLIAVAFLSLFIPGLLSCAAQPEQANQPAAETGPATARAVCVLHATEGNQAHGTVIFTQEGEQMKVVADVEGVAPGKHGFHIHEFGDCSAPDGSSAGGHFNPDGKPHGAPADAERHVGDLGNIEGGPDGMAHLEWTDSFLSLSGPHSILGRGVIVHAGEDDLKSQPTGNAGGRVACGVIGVAK
ncbi:MAG: superoxide dismutase family protein [Acidobacteria bacterium]|nr:superoxide dismutase family protein [Acidobacteriota bacterium]